MARSVVASGTQACSVGTEHTLRDETSNEGKVFDAAIDLGNLATSDVLEIRLYVKALSGGTLRRVYYAKYTDSQDNVDSLKSPIVYVPAVTVMKEWKLTVKQTAGTGRNVDWTVYSD
jgi:hypothetical protein